MNTCVICGKQKEGITLELEEDDGQIRETYVCKSCSEVIASIAFKVVSSEIKSLADELEPLVEFITNLKKLDDESGKFREHISKLEEATSELEDLLSKDEESLEDDDDDSEFSNDEKQFLGIPNETLAEQLLSFAKEIDLADEDTDLLDSDMLELFWKSKGIRNKYSASAESKIKMKQVEKKARAKIVERVFSASNDDLARELADFAKKKDGKENGQGVYVQSSTFSFWRSKGLDYRAESLEIETRKGQVEQLAQEIVDKDFHDWRDKRLQMESQYLPKLVQACVEWARSTGRSSVTIKDVKFFRQEKKIELLEATERALYLSTNSELKSKK